MSRVRWATCGVVLVYMYYVVCTQSMQVTIPICVQLAFPAH
eukprot:SAG25_NODE_4_length_30349_cov_110.018280_17_plen_41_part_00